jgi:glycerol-3-phosphate dehydrogenase (NAD(P)+)
MAMSAAAHPAGHQVRLWARDAVQAGDARSRQALPAGPGVCAGPEVVQGDALDAVADAELVIIGTPMAALREWLQRLQHLHAPRGLAVQGL